MSTTTNQRGPILLSAILFLAVILFAGCEQPVPGPSDTAPREETTYQGEAPSDLVARALDEMRDSLDAAGFGAAETAAILAATVDSIGVTAQSDSLGNALPTIVAEAEKSLGTDELAALSEEERQSAVEAIVAGAVGTIGSVSASARAVAPAVAPAARIDLLRLISQEAVAHLDDAGISDIPASARRAARSAVRALRRAGITREDMEGSLESLTVGAFAGVERALSTDSADGAAARIVGGIVAGVTGGLGDTTVDRVDIATDLPQFVRRITQTATKSIATVPIVGDDDAAAIVRAITRGATGAVRDALGNQATTERGRQALRKAVAEITEGASESLEETRAALAHVGVTVEMSVAVRFIAKGAAEGIDALSAGDEDDATEYEEILTAARSGIVKGAARAGHVLDSSQLDDLRPPADRPGIGRPARPIPANGTSPISGPG